MAERSMLGRGGGFMLGLDLSYTLGSFSLSAPQTTERRMRDEEGTSETPQQAMHWVWIATCKMVAYTGIPALLDRNVWPFIGGIVAILDMHGSYRYAIKRGCQSPTPGGHLLSRLGVTVDPGTPNGRSEAPPTPVGAPQGAVRRRPFSW